MNVKSTSSQFEQSFSLTKALPRLMMHFGSTSWSNLVLWWRYVVLSMEEYGNNYVINVCFTYSTWLSDYYYIQITTLPPSCGPHHRVGANCRSAAPPLHDLMTAQMATRLKLGSFEHKKRSLYSPEKWLHNRINCPCNRSKHIKETHTAYSAGTQYTRQSLNEKQHTWLHRQTDTDSYRL